jgi:D-hydroxyproline dehydrogenase subunit alpha
VTPQGDTSDVVVVGGGPAGLAAAAQAAAAGLAVTLVDERVTLGGQIHKQPGLGFEVLEPRRLGRDYLNGRRLIEAVQRSGARVLLRTAVVSIDGDELMLCEDEARVRSLRAGRIVLAPGAYDRPVAFPGWTLPGVLTAGGAQTMIKTQRVLPGERIVFCGSGPVALAFPAQLHHYGANVVLVCEAGPAPGPRALAALLGAARGNTDLLADAARYRLGLLRARAPMRHRRIVVAAEGDGRVEAVVHAAVDRSWRVIAGTQERIAADTLCVGYGFVPSVELLRLAGATFADDDDRGGPVALVDEWMRTSAPGVLAAGDGTGVEGSFVAVDEGRLAGLGAALDLGAVSPEAAARDAAPIRRRLERRRAFRRALEHMHALGPGIYELSDPQTVVCRCEEVARAALDEAIEGSADLGVVRGLTRAGMGLCQGRNCQRQVAALIAARHRVVLGDIALATARLPARPLPLAALADDSIEDHGLFTSAATPRA